MKRNPGRAVLAGLVFEFLDQTRFANTSLATEQYDLALARLHLRSALAEVSGQRKTLLTDTVEIGAQGTISKVVFPQAGRQEWDLKGGMGINALEHVDEVDIGIDAW